MTQKNNHNTPGETIPFLLKISHELKSSIHGVAGISSYLSTNWNKLEEETVRKVLMTISDASNNLEKLVNILINNVADKGEIKFHFVELDIIKIVDSTVTLCKNLYINRCNIKFEHKMDQCMAMIDPFWYGQLLSNLLINSINYSKQGTVTVKLFVQKINNINHCVVYVCDEGTGIDDKELNFIFDPFTRGSKNSLNNDGLGLGLFICKEIVEAHRGNISASNSDIGAVFKFAVPIKNFR